MSLLKRVGGLNSMEMSNNAKCGRVFELRGCYCADDIPCGESACRVTAGITRRWSLYTG